MTTDLREKLERLIEEWRAWCLRMPALHAERLTREVDADQLAALLAESEEPCCRWKAERKTQPAPNPGQTHYVGDDCPGGHAEECTEWKPCRRKHENDRPGIFCEVLCKDCGRRKEAHGQPPASACEAHGAHVATSCEPSE